MNVRLSGIIENSLNNGEGIRKVIFAQGCKHDCKGCFNPGTHSFDGGYDCDTEKIIERINEDYMIDGVTFSGGDPFEQPEAFYEIGRNIKTNIWCYTGYTYEYIVSQFENKPEWAMLMSVIDVLVDGRFDINKVDDSNKYRGSSNQRVISVPLSLLFDKPVSTPDLMHPKDNK